VATSSCPDRGESAGPPHAGSQFWAGTRTELLETLGTDPVRGLGSDEAQRRLDETHHAEGTRQGSNTALNVLLRQFTSPIILILLVAAVISFLVDDAPDGVIVIVIVVASGLLGFWQEYRAGTAVRALLERVRVTTTVLRDGVRTDLALSLVVPGDLVELTAGSIVPADGRILDSDSLLVDESALTGESFPIEKRPSDTVAAGAALAERTNCVFQASHVVSGTAHIAVVATGRGTEFGRVSQDLARRAAPTEFERGMGDFGDLLLRIMLVLTAFIFVVNWTLGRPVIEALMFALALAIGLTPQMLPAITAVSLSTGARKMAARKVIVKRLEAIEDLGSVSILCTDKTGTITRGVAGLDRAEPLRLREADDGSDDAPGLDEDVLRLALANAGLQSGFRNPLDEAILERGQAPATARAVEELPYDFTRKRLSVAVAGLEPAVPLELVCKGAFDSVLGCCASARVDGLSLPIDDVKDIVESRFEKLSANGFRVLAIATRTIRLAPGQALTPADESDLELRGLLCFHDPVKPDVPAQIDRLARLGVDVKVVTGDNRFAAAKVTRDLGLDASRVMTGRQIDAAGDDALEDAVGAVSVFAEVEPAQKARIVRALRHVQEAEHRRRAEASRPDRGRGGRVRVPPRCSVAFLGDGINDAPALHAADVGISVDTAHEVARDAAAVVLLDKSLGVVIDGIRLGRETFANTLKYVRVTTSANFGNMASMAVASLFLPFLPLLPRQVLVLNFLTDLPSMAIASDRVDDELVRRPGRWRISSIRGFMIVFGLLSALFDVVTFLVLVLGFHTGATAFRSAWFVESTLTELAVLFSMRTALPMFRSRPAAPLALIGLAVAAVVFVLPYSPLAPVLGLEAVAGPVLATLAAITVAYVAANELLKRRVITDWAE